jgi:AraC family transcriptional regulator
MQSGQQSSESVWSISRASEALDGLRPLLSNAKSKDPDLAVERYIIGNSITTPPLRFKNQHLVGIQWTGEIKETGSAFRSISTPNATSIFPVGLALQERTMHAVDFTNLSLSPSFLQRVAREIDLSDRFELEPQWGIRDEQVESIAHSAEYEIQSELKAGRLFMESLATALAAHLLSRYSSRRVALREYRGGLSPHQLRQTRDYIEANLGEKLGLADLAVNVRISPYYFCRMFKQSMGVSPHQFVIRRRIEKGQQLLKEHRLTITEVASSLGFSDQSHFARVFLGLVGTTPRRYASQL